MISKCHSYKALSDQLQQVTDTMPAFVAQCSRDLRYLWVSKSYADWCGLSSDDIMGRPIADVLGAEAFQKLRPRYQAVLSGRKVTCEEEINFAGTGRRWISASYEPTFDDAGVPDGWVAAIVDIDSLKRAEKALAERTVQQAAVATLGKRR